MDFFRYLDPLRYFTRQEYVSFWGRLFETVLSGIWARLISVCFLTLSFYFMARRQNMRIFIVFFLLAIAIAYIGGIREIFR
ncbi:MAG: hypothetical protein M0033_01450 [Nitrospiraceae bacterium]|nr:hypothetical protein [Nitrospiraceae bacterium]